MTKYELKIVSVIVAYCTISLVLIFANKHLVGKQTSTVDVSLFIAWAQCLVIVVFTSCVNVAKGLWTGNWSFVKDRHSILLSATILRVSFTTAGMLAFNSLCLRHVSVSFYQVAKSTTILFLVVFSITILKKSVSVGIFICCLVVSGGFILGVDQEELLGTLSIQGIEYGVISSLFVALNGIFIKQALDLMNGSALEVTYYGNINASFLFIPMLYSSGQMQDVIRVYHTWTYGYWICLIATGVLSFLIAWTGGMQINLTSPITHHIVTNAKSVLQTLLAVMYYREYKSWLWWLSNSLVVVGTLAYTIIKIMDEKTNEKLLPTIEETDESETELANSSV